MDQKDTVHIMLKLCRAALDGAAPTLPCLTDEQMKVLYALAKHHDMAHLVSYALYRVGRLDTTTAIGAAFQKAQMLAVFRYENQRTELEQICRVLEHGGIDFVPLKGSRLRACYPEPWMRTSVDIDVLVRPEQLGEAEQALMRELGYQKDHGSAHDVSLTAPSGVHVELHFDLIEEGQLSEAANTPLRDVWSYAAPLPDQKHYCALTDGMFYYYHVAHMAKHFYGGGCGIRSYADLWLLCHGPDADAEGRAALLARGGLERFDRAAREVCDAWFSGAEMDETAREMATYVLRGGTFGVAENRVAVQQSKGKSKLRYMLDSVFMPYDQLCTYYESLKGRRYLTFFYQIRRIFRLLGEGKARGAVRELQINSRMNEGEIDRANALLERLGL